MPKIFAASSILPPVLARALSILRPSEKSELTEVCVPRSSKWEREKVSHLFSWEPTINLSQKFLSSLTFPDHGYDNSKSKASLVKLLYLVIP